jgi:hypothetical protein
MPGLEHQHPVACRQGVDQGRFPGAGTGGGVDHHVVVGLEDGLDLGQDLAAKRAEFRPAMVDGGVVDGPENAIRHVGRPGDLQEMAAARRVAELDHGVSPQYP